MRRGKSIRIIGGEHRGKQLASPKDYTVRPTSDRVREAVFNILLHGPLPDLGGCDVLDLYAGSGALGLEALSRGARRAVFVEQDAESLTLIRENIRRLRVDDDAQIIAGNVLRLADTGGPFGLIFMDPPYAAAKSPQTIDHVLKHEWLEPGGVIVAETPAKSEPPAAAGLREYTSRRYGRTRIVIFVRENE